jgi:hypothetical protein
LLFENQPGRELAFFDKQYLQQNTCWRCLRHFQLYGLKWPKRHTPESSYIDNIFGTPGYTPMPNNRRKSGGKNNTDLESAKDVLFKSTTVKGKQNMKPTNHLDAVTPKRQPTKALKQPRQKNIDGFGDAVDYIEDVDESDYADAVTQKRKPSKAKQPRQKKTVSIEEALGPKEDVDESDYADAMAQKRKPSKAKQPRQKKTVSIEEAPGSIEDVDESDYLDATNQKRKPSKAKQPRQKRAVTIEETPGSKKDVDDSDYADTLAQKRKPSKAKQRRPKKAVSIQPALDYIEGVDESDYADAPAQKRKPSKAALKQHKAIDKISAATGSKRKRAPYTTRDGPKKRIARQPKSSLAAQQKENAGVNQPVKEVDSAQGKGSVIDALPPPNALETLQSLIPDGANGTTRASRKRAATLDGLAYNSDQFVPSKLHHFAAICAERGALVQQEGFIFLIKAEISRRGFRRRHYD